MDAWLQVRTRSCRKREGHDATGGQDGLRLVDCESPLSANLDLEPAGAYSFFQLQQVSISLLQDWRAQPAKPILQHPIRHCGLRHLPRMEQGTPKLVVSDAQVATRSGACLPIGREVLFALQKANPVGSPYPLPVL